MENYADLTPDETITKVECRRFPAEIVQKNYGKVMARQMPVSLYGIAALLKKEGVDCEYVGNFADDAAIVADTGEHLYKGQPVIIETSRIRRKGRVGSRSLSDKKYAGSSHYQMILLGIDEDGQAVFTGFLPPEPGPESGGDLKRGRVVRTRALYVSAEKCTGHASVFQQKKKHGGM